METKLRKLRILLSLIVLITLIAVSSGLALAAEDIEYDADNLYLLGLDFDYGGSINDQTVAYAFWFDNSGELHVAIAMQHNNGPASIALNDVSTTNYVLYPADRDTLVINSNNYGTHTASAGSVASHLNSRWLVINFGKVSLETLAETFKLTVTTELGGGHYLGGTGTVYIVFLSYNVFYDANVGTGTQTDFNEYEEGDDVTVLDPGAMARTGFTFTGWNTTANGSGTAYQPGATFSMPAANVVLYAQWEAIDYTLTINYYYGSVGGTVASPIYIDDNLNVGDAYSVASPVISGYTASQATVAGTMPANNVTVNVIYTAVGERDPFIPSPSITVKKHISVDGGTNWLDAETVPGPSVEEGSALRFKFVVTNTGNVSLSDLTLTDSDFTLSGAVKPAFLNPGASFEYILTGITASAGQHQNTAYASGAYGGLVYSDFDHAHYWGSKKDAPSISIKKYISVDKGLIWLDANTGPGPTADVGKEVRYKFVIVNSGNVPLTGLSLTDSKHTLVGLTLPASLASGATIEYILAGVEAMKGEQLNSATVSGVYNRVTYSDSDKAYYTGKVPVVPEPAKPAVTVKKYVSVNEGSTWLDADTAPGPSALIDNDVWFKFIMTNSGNVTLTDLTLTDSEYNLGNVGLPAKLDPGQSFEYIFKGVKAKAGEQMNIAVALAKYGNETVTDTDRAIYTGYRKGKPTPPTTGGYLPLSAILGMLLISGGIFLKKKSKALNH